MKRFAKIGTWVLAGMLGITANGQAQNFPGPAGDPSALAGGGMPCYPGGPAPASGPGLPSLDVRAGNAFADEVDPYSPLRFQCGVDYLFLWYKPMGIQVPLLTSGSLFDVVPGAIGEDNTVLLINQNQLDAGLSSAFRIRGVLWAVDPEILAVEANFWINEQRSQFFANASDDMGEPILTRPFFNPVNNQEEARIISSTLVAQGTTLDVFQTRLAGAESNLRWNLTGSVGARDGTAISLLAGVRWMQIDERYFNRDFSTDIATGISTLYQDNFATYNDFYAGQLGLGLATRWDRFAFDINAKFAVGSIQQTIKVAGSTFIDDPANGFTLTDNRLGTFAQLSNVGNYERDSAAFLSDFSANFSFDITEHIRLKTGYSVLSLNNVVRPVDQIDRRLNLQVVGLGAQNDPALPAQPDFNQVNFWVQWVNLGLEIVF